MDPEISLEYYIEVEEIRAIAHKYRFAAKPVVSKNVDVSVFPTRPPLKEFWGETEGDAQAKVRKAMEEWAAAQGIALAKV